VDQEFNQRMATDESIAGPLVSSERRRTGRQRRRTWRGDLVAPSWRVWLTLTVSFARRC